MSFFNRNNPYLNGKNGGSNAISESKVYPYSFEQKHRKNRVFVPSANHPDSRAVGGRYIRTIYYGGSI